MNDIRVGGLGQDCGREILPRLSTPGSLESFFGSVLLPYPRLLTKTLGRI